MALRKRYQNRPEISSRSDAPPVMPDAETKPIKPPEMSELQSPADAAASSAIKDRLAEMEKADALSRQPQQSQPPEQQEPQQPPAMPAAVVKFLAENPRYSDPNDAIAQGEIYVATLKCNRDGKNWNDDDFIPHLERHLGIAPAVNGNDVPKQNTNAPPAPRHEAPRQPARMSAPVSAPPTREPPSMSTGRSPRYRPPLTADELLIAQQCGQTPEQYQAQKERMLRMKASGEIQNG